LGAFQSTKEASSAEDVEQDSKVLHDVCVCVRVRVRACAAV